MIGPRLIVSGWGFSHDPLCDNNITIEFFLIENVIKIIIILIITNITAIITIVIITISNSLKR